MHPARFRTLCECMGWTSEAGGRMLGVDPRTVRRWFDPEYPYDIPDDIQLKVETAWYDFLHHLGETLDVAEETAEEHGDPQAIHIARPRGSTGASAIQAATVQALTILLEVQGFTVELDWAEE